MVLSRIGCSAMFALVFALSASSAGAADPERPGVARVSLLHGTVEIARADSGETVAATINAPLAAGDYLKTRDDARAEVEFGYGTALRLAPATSLRVVALSEDRARVQLAVGTVELRVARSLRAHSAIETPRATVTALERARIRIAVAPGGDTTVTVRSGRADVVADGGSRTVEAGSALAIGAGETPLRTLVAASDDEFDRWTDARDRSLAETADTGYVDDGMVGASDLSAYGRWIDDPRYGRVWSPNERSDWAPYHDGRFAWEPYYGWTWVAAEPWGWAPYHYGNWFYAANSGWCWYPGAYAFGDPFVYRPATVAFFSFGGGSSLGYGIGWVPLAPYETFAPWYGNAPGVTIVNTTTNVTVVAPSVPAATGRVFTIYHNAGAPGGAVVLDRHSFADGDFRKLQSARMALLAHATPLRGSVPIVPTNASLLFGPTLPSSVTLGRPQNAGFAARRASSTFESGHAQVRTPTAFHAAPPPRSALPPERRVAPARFQIRPIARPIVIDEVAPAPALRSVPVAKPHAGETRFEGAIPRATFVAPNAELRFAPAVVSQPNHVGPASVPTAPRATERRSQTLGREMPLTTRETVRH